MHKTAGHIQIKFVFLSNLRTELAKSSSTSILAALFVGFTSNSPLLLRKSALISTKINALVQNAYAFLLVLKLFLKKLL